MSKLPKVVNNRASAASLRWTGLAIACMQVIYVVGTLISEHTTGIKTPYSLMAVFIMLATMSLLAVVNFARAIFVPKHSFAYHCVVVAYYVSVILFSICVYNPYRDAAIAILWIILLATTGILFGRASYCIGVVAMVISTAANPIVIQHYDFEHIVSLILTILLTVFASFLFYRYREWGLIEIRDYNQLKRRERMQTRRLRAVVNNLKDALISIGVDGNVQLYNSATLDLLNTNRDIMGVDADKLFNLIDDDGNVVALSSVVKSATRTIERTDLRLAYSDGQKINLQLTIIPVKNQFTVHSVHDLDGVIVMARDITKQKSLDDERDEFIGVVSHELRTPVAIAEGALSNLQLLLERQGDPHVFASTLDAAHKQILYLGQMVNDLSTLSRAQRGLYMNNEQIDIDDFMTSLYNKYNEEAKNRKLRLIVDINVAGTVTVPSMVIEEIMQNLITNAIKYTPKGSVTIGVDPIAGDKNHARFYVRDTGIGISKSDMEHIFQRFWRSEDYRTRQTSGTGLGLHVVEQLASKIGAKVNVESKLNKGSVFSVVLPIVPTKKK